MTRTTRPLNINDFVKKPKPDRKASLLDLRKHKSKDIGTKLCIVMRMLSDDMVLIFAYVSSIKGSLKNKKKWLKAERRKEEYWFRRICDSIRNEVPN